ncbi:hypothetical protein Hanom_Chr10g00930541 [Helianthus anomalus]
MVNNQKQMLANKFNKDKSFLSHKKITINPNHSLKTTINLKFMSIKQFKISSPGLITIGLASHLHVETVN